MLKRGLSARTVRQTHGVLSPAFKQAVTWRLLSSGPASAVDLPIAARDAALSCFCSGRRANVSFKAMKQTNLYDPIRRWLAADRFAARVTGDAMSVVVPISGLVPMPFKIPDVIGTRDGRVAIVEVEQRKARFFDAMGRCLLWKCTASYVYLAFPAGVVDRAPILKKLGLGLLTVDPSTGVVSAPIHLPREGLDFRLTQELYPLEAIAEQQLHRQLEANCL